MLGRHWTKASLEQRERFTRAFREYLIELYVDTMVRYVDEIVAHREAIDFPPTRWSPEHRDAVVRMVLRVRDTVNVDVDYRLRRHDARWRIHDVRIEGVSLALVHRRSFASMIERTGLDQVTAELESRAARP